MTDSDIQSVALVAHPHLPEAIRQMNEIADFLIEYNIQIEQGLLYDEILRQRVKERQFEVLIALGGDGTMLRAGHLCGPVDVPILGINIGHFGFLMEIQQNQWREIMKRLIKRDFWIEKRMMLLAEQWRAGERMGDWEILNEIVVGRGQIVRPVHLITHVDNRYLTTYVADALIASTATGSTAYAMAAGGPILPPELRNILLIAVAPHLSIDHALVLHEGSSVSITVHTDHQAVLSPDGQAPIGIADGDRVDVRASENSVKFIRFQDPGYFYRNLTPHMDRNPTTGDRR